jgi:hypothetical protein
MMIMSISSETSNFHICIHLPANSMFHFPSTVVSLCCLALIMRSVVNTSSYRGPSVSTNIPLSTVSCPVKCTDDPDIIVSRHVQLIIVECCNPLFSIYTYPDASTST